MYHVFPPVSLFYFILFYPTSLKNTDSEAQVFCQIHLPPPLHISTHDKKKTHMFDVMLNKKAQLHDRNLMIWHHMRDFNHTLA